MTRRRTATLSPSGSPGSRPALGTGWVRLVRAGVLGGASLFLATAGHVLGGGGLPGAGLLMLTGVALALVAVSLTARRQRFPTLLVVLAAEQALLHLVFHAATAASTCTTVAMPGHAMAAVCGAGAPATSGWSMVAGHLAAVLATAWLLARGEQWLWRVVDRAHRYATSRPTVRRRSRPPLAAAADTVLRTLRWVLAGPRGPPLALI